MPTKTRAILTLGQWLSPSYPIGAFAYSHGLEAAVDAGWVKDSAGLEDWLGQVLTTGAGRNDACFIAAAWRADGPGALAGIDATARAFAASRERLLETTQQGAAFGAVTGAIWGGDLAQMTYPVALGAAAARADLPLDLTLSLYLQAFASNLIAAAQRLLPLGQTEGQAILHRLSALIPAIAQDSGLGNLASLSATAFLADIAAMRHETTQTRIFRT